MSASTLIAAEGVRDDLLTNGFAVTSSTELGWPPPEDFLGAFNGYLAPDPRGPGKLHARDVVAYVQGEPVPGLAEADSVAFHHSSGTVYDDYSRFLLLKSRLGRPLCAGVLSLVPPGLARSHGLMSVDWFHYSPGTDSPPHQDGFGDLVVIWVLAREGEGGESFLQHLTGGFALHRALAPGEILVFRDELFLHGLSPLAPGASRDAVIFITLRDA